MRVVSGTIRGLKLKFPKEVLVRPTTEKVKEAIFDSLQFRIEGKSFLDLFAGCGQMGIEALSRGAREVCLVDSYRDSVCAIRYNLSKLDENLSKKVSIVNKDVFYFLKTNPGHFDIVFMDPPYREGTIPEVLEELSDCVSYDGIVICEHEKSEVLPEKVKNLSVFKNKNYGKISVTYYAK